MVFLAKLFDFESNRVVAPPQARRKEKSHGRVVMIPEAYL
jgi:hypothetical protein